MAQARVLTYRELKQVLKYNDGCERHAARNRLMLLFTHWASMQIGEVAGLRGSDVLPGDGPVRTETRLSSSERALFRTQKNQQFSANTATHLLQLKVNAARYREFLEERRKLMADMIRRYYEAL